MNFLCNNEAQDDLSEGSEVEDLFGLNAAVNVNKNAAVEVIVPDWAMF